MTDIDELQGKKVVIKGRVSFSGLSKKITSQYDQFNGNQALYRLKLNHVEVVKGQTPEAADFIKNKFYEGKDENAGVYFYDFASNSDYSPAIYDKNHPDDPVTCEEKDKELAKDQLVLVSLELFKPKKYNNIGVGIAAIQVQDIDNPATWANVGQASFADAFDF